MPQRLMRLRVIGFDSLFYLFISHLLIYLMLYALLTSILYSPVLLQSRTSLTYVRHCNPGSIVVARQRRMDSL